MAGPIVETAAGRLRGLEQEGGFAFLGVPYATVPDDAELARFGPPAPPAPWSGVRDAQSFGPIAPQIAIGPASLLSSDGLAQGEEPRNLNVWTPACDDGRRPVLVFIHGGAFSGGTGSSSLYRGDRLCRRGVVVVTFNYRLGALGFLSHPALEHPGAPVNGNYGLQDQIAALGWVRRHAAVFGGDPGNITVFGESAGAMSVCALLGAPGARGLFRRAVIQSGMAFAHRAPLAHRLAEDLCARLGIGAPSRRALVALPSDELLAAQHACNREVDEGMGMPFAPVVDGTLLARHPADLIADGAGSPEVAVLAGTNRDEFTMFSLAASLPRDLDRSALEALVGRYLVSSGRADLPDPAAVVDLYERERAGRGDAATARALLDAFGTDWIFRVPLTRMLEAHGRHGAPTFCYRFDWPSPFGGGALGACHGIELPFVFGTLADPVVSLFTGAGEDALALADQIQSAWVAFATSGDPTHPGIGPWPTYEPVRRSTLVLGAGAPSVVEAPAEAERAFLDAALGRYGEGDARARTLAFLAPDGDTTVRGENGGPPGAAGT